MWGESIINHISINKNIHTSIIKIKIRGLIRGEIRGLMRGGRGEIRDTRPN